MSIVRRMTGITGRVARIAVCVAALAMAGVANAAAINYGNYVGTTVTFENVTENSITDAVPLYGAPAIAADSLVFSPIGFGATSTGGGVDITDGTLTMRMVSKPGLHISEILFSEAGDYTIAGVGTAATQVAVAAPVFITVLEIDHVPVTPINMQFAMTFTTSNQFNLPNDAGIGVIWNGTLNIDMTAALINKGVPFLGGATKLNFTFDNTLIATSEAGSTSLIQKKAIDGVGITVETVPNPATLTMLAVGVLATIRRRRIA